MMSPSSREKDLHLWLRATQYMFRHTRVLSELPILAVNGHEISWSHEREDELQLFS
jgi:hypothetical protein